MKGKLLIGLTMAALISANCFAYEIHKGKITKHKEWSTGNIKFTFKDAKSNPTSLKLPEKAKLKDGTPYMYAVAEAHKVDTSVDGITFVETGSQVIVSNNTDSPKQFLYNFTSCLQTSTHTMDCAYYYDEITLEPNGWAAPNRVDEMGVIYSEPGEYDIHASTGVGLLSDEGQYVNHSMATSTSKVIVASNKH